jgi:hypothetical protein
MMRNIPVPALNQPLGTQQLLFILNAITCHSIANNAVRVVWLRVSKSEN